MTEKEFLKHIHRKIAISSIGASALRNQGASGIIKTAREFFNEINIEDFFNSIANDKDYLDFLNSNTQNLLNLFPENGKTWGGARKGLTLFFREIIYNNFFSDYYNLPKNLLEFNTEIKNLEVPLDLDVATGIIKDSKSNTLKWSSIKRLNLEISNNFQYEAMIIAQSEKIARVNLDLKYWRKKI